MKLAKLAAAMAVITMMTVLAAPAVSAEDSVDLTATVLEPKPEIGIELNATALSFGSLYPGNTSEPQDLKVTNIGLKEIDVTATASDDGTEPLFVPGLLIDGASYNDYLATLTADESDDTQLALHVPDDYASRGAVSGGATFWAEEHVHSSPVEHFTYSSDGSSVTITGYVGPGGDVIIPSKIDNLPVTSIGYSAFGSNAQVVSVTIPDSVVTISNEAFYYCTALASVTIPNSVTSIGNNAFQGSTLESVVIPDSVTSIGNYAFNGCSHLASVTIGSGLTSITKYAFMDCNHLTSVTIGSGVTSIGTNTFRSCSSLTSMTFEGNAPTVGSNWALNIPSTMIVYYYQGATGFTNPWNGFTTMELSL